MADPRESLRRYFTMSEQASNVALDRIEVLVDRKIVPGFKEEYSKQSRLQGERRAEQANIGDSSPHSPDHLIQTLQQLFGR